MENNKSLDIEYVKEILLHIPDTLVMWELRDTASLESLIEATSSGHMITTSMWQEIDKLNQESLIETINKFVTDSVEKEQYLEWINKLSEIKKEHWYIK